MRNLISLLLVEAIEKEEQARGEEQSNDPAIEGSPRLREVAGSGNHRAAKSGGDGQRCLRFIVLHDQPDKAPGSHKEKECKENRTRGRACFGVGRLLKIPQQSSLKIAA